MLDPQMQVAPSNARPEAQKPVSRRPTNDTVNDHNRPTPGLTLNQFLFGVRPTRR